MRKNICDMGMAELKATMNEYFDAIEIANANLDRARMELGQAVDEWYSTKWLIEQRVKFIRAELEAELVEARSRM